MNGILKEFLYHVIQIKVFELTIRMHQNDFCLNMFFKTKFGIILVKQLARKYLKPLRSETVTLADNL